MVRARAFLPVRSPACVALAALASLVAGCPPPAASPSSVRGEIGPAGGALSIEGAVLVVPAGAVARPTTFSITRLPVSALPVVPERRLSDYFRFEPEGLDLAVPARVTLRAVAFSSAPMARWSLPGSTTEFEDVPPLFSSSVAITSERARLGSVFCEGRGTVVRDAGVPDAPPRDAPSRDAPPIDAPRLDTGPPPVPPVTVGVDLTPANFACRGTRTAPPLGPSPAPMPVVVTEYLDGGGRATFFTSRDESGVLAASNTDSTGMGTVAARAGTWTTLDFDFTAGASAGLTIPAQSAYFLTFGPSPRTRVEVLSQRTWDTIVAGLTTSGETRGVIVGSVVDCDGALVQRARVRFFVGATELVPAPFDFSVGYSSGATRVPALDATRTSIDGVFYAVGAYERATGLATSVRVEVWGALALGGPEERLGCEEVTTRIDGPVAFRVGPSRADGPASCL